MGRMRPAIITVNYARHSVVPLDKQGSCTPGAEPRPADCTSSRDPADRKELGHEIYMTSISDAADEISIDDENESL